MTLLSNREILRHLHETGAIVISPFDERALNNVSVDITLGDTIARYRSVEGVLDLSKDDPAEAFWIEKATSRREDSPRGFLLAAGERVLAHSREIAGGRQVTTRLEVLPRCDCDELNCDCDQRFVDGPTVAVTTSIHATSTAARIGLQICGCAGFGDCGFLSPWIYELFNCSPRSMWIPVGAVIAQVSFSEIDPLLPDTSYDQIGSYQKGRTDPAEILKTWTILDGLPKKLKVRP